MKSIITQPQPVRGIYELHAAISQSRPLKRVRRVALNNLDPKETYYYVEISGFSYNGDDALVSKMLDLKYVVYSVRNCGIESLTNIVMVGVQKQALADVKKNGQLHPFVRLFAHYTQDSEV